MCFWNKKPPEKQEPKKPTGFPVYEIGWNDLKASLSEVGLELMLKAKFVPDAKIFYTDLQSWSKIMPFLTFSGEYYTQGTDCDDYGRRASVESAFEFGLNGCLECWGQSPRGYHAFALVLTGPESFMLFEPNAGFDCAGELFKDGKNGYKAESWKV